MTFKRILRQLSNNLSMHYYPTSVTQPTIYLCITVILNVVIYSPDATIVIRNLFLQSRNVAFFHDVLLKARQIIEKGALLQKAVV